MHVRLITTTTITSALRLLLGAVLLALGGCSTWLTDDFIKPEIQLIKVDVERARLLDQRFLLHFQIDNPNSMSLPVRGLDYRLTLAGVPLAEGHSSDWFTIEAHSRKVVKIPVRTNLWRNLKTVIAALKDPQHPLPYQFEGRIDTGLLFNKQVPLRKQGQITPGAYLLR